MLGGSRHTNVLALWMVQSLEWRLAQSVTVEPVQISQKIASNPGAEDFFQQIGFTSTIVENGHMNGHFLKLADGAGRFSVSPPLPGGCGTLAFPGEAGKLHDPPCKYTINGGMFDVVSDRAKAGTFDCFGNLVSDGKVIQTPPYNKSNVQFGVKDGKYVVGYINETEATKFEQLVEGLGWLVRDGKNYIKPHSAGGLKNATGWTEAYTGASSGGYEYAEKVTGRVAIGYNALGELLIMVIDGHTGDPPWGASMAEAADKMIEQGAIEAICLDGGTSTQMYVNGIEVGYSSARAAWGLLTNTYDLDCPKGNSTDTLGRFECKRMVSSFLCITEANTESTTSVRAASSTWLACAVGGVILTLLAAAVVFRVKKDKQEPSTDEMETSLASEE